MFGRRIPGGQLFQKQVAPGPADRGQAEKLGGRVAVHLQGAVDAARLEGRDPVEELPAADPEGLANLRRRQLPAARQPHGQPPPLVADRLAIGQRRHDGGRQIGTFQMKSFWHGAKIICAPQIV